LSEVTEVCDHFTGN